MKKYMVIIAILIFILGVLVGRGLKYKEKVIIPQVKEKIRSSLKPLTGFTVQVGSYKEENRAQSVVAKLKEKGYDAYLASMNLPSEGTLHRVRVGKFRTREDAFSTLKKLMVKEGLRDAYITSR